MAKLLCLLCLFSIQNYLIGQPGDEDAIMISKIHEFSLTQAKGYQWLGELCKGAGPRLAGSPAYQRAVEITGRQLASIAGVNVYTQETKAGQWQRGQAEEVYLHSKSSKKLKLNALSLGNSIGTGRDGVRAEVIEVLKLSEIDSLDRSEIEGKIVFFNRPMDASKIRTFYGYGGAVDQRVHGASKAASKGAVAVLVRSMTTQIDDYPHTGTLIYKEGERKIPACAISTLAANQLSEAIKKGKCEISIKNFSVMNGEVPCHNVIGEIKGSEHPEEIILVGGHLDAWDVGEGAHDDGSGCAQSMEVLNTLVALKYKPKRTIRCVLFANEENGLSGGRAYSKIANEKKEFHLAAIESDAGGFSPRGFSFDADTAVLKTYYKTVSGQYLPLLENYGLSFELGGSGADISPLKSMKGLLIGLRPDSQRYFDYHHTAKDVFTEVHPRELLLGAAAMTSLVYLIDKYGLN